MKKSKREIFMMSEEQRKKKKSWSREKKDTTTTTNNSKADTKWNYNLTNCTTTCRSVLLNVEHRRVLFCRDFHLMLYKRFKCMHTSRMIKVCVNMIKSLKQYKNLTIITACIHTNLSCWTTSPWMTVAENHLISHFTPIFCMTMTFRPIKPQNHSA